MSQSPDDDPNFEPKMREIRFEYTPGLPEILAHLRASILVTTYQAGKLLVLGTHQGKLTISFLNYDQPMGLAVSPERIAIGTRRQMHFLVPAHETQSPEGPYDGCFVPRSTQYTGSIHSHDLGWGRDGLWIVNTLFSCLSTLHDDFSFVPQWRPPFISQLIDQDRCHLNGMAMENGLPKYVSAMGETDTANGWRPKKANSGVIMEVPSGQVICRGLSMPHSPRLYGGRLWALNSGYGALGWIDTPSGQYHQVESMPGYTRGLSFYGQFAFVGLSKIRETSVFGGVPIAEQRDNLRCGVGVVDLTSGKTVAVFQFHSGVSEIFAVDVLPGFANPLIAGASIDQQEREVWIVPAESMPRPKPGVRPPIYAGVAELAAPSVLETTGWGTPGAPAAAHRASVGELVTAAQNFRAQGQFELAAHSYEAAIAAHPQPAHLLVDLGNLRQDQGNQQAALLCYERALQADPRHVVALQNLGYLLFNMGEAEKSHDILERLLALDPAPLNKLLAASVLPVIYDSSAEVEFWRKRQMAILDELVASGARVDATRSLVPTCFFAAYQGLCDRELMAKRGQVIAGRDYVTGQPRVTRSSGRVKVGFLSAYFRDHTIGRLNVQRLEHLDRTAIELSIIYAGALRDEVTERFARTADRFIQLPRDVQPAATQIAQLELDILVHADVGMDALTQTLAYSRLAPVQLATWGHPDTTGSPMIDYFLSSRHLEPSDAGGAYTEQLWMLPSLGIDYERPRVTRPKTRGQLGLVPQQHLYACPQTLFKFHPEFDAILAQILERDSVAQIVLLEGRLPEWTHRLKRRFRRTLPESGRRVQFLPALPREDFLSLLSVSEVVLDPIHFGGGNSSLEAIAMGTPVVTLEGRYLRSRITSAIYRQINLPELIAHDANQYVELAVRLGTQVEYRREIRQRLEQSAEGLFDRRQASVELAECLLSLAR